MLVVREYWFEDVKLRKSIDMRPFKDCIESQMRMEDPSVTVKVKKRYFQYKLKADLKSKI